MRADTSVPLAPALVLFMISGACGLCYEVVWARELVLVFGAGALATAATLAGFMAGLGVGGLALGPRADGLERPLRFYGLLELAIGLFGLVSADVIRGGLRGAFAMLTGVLALESPVSREVLRLALTLLAVVPPAALMGATFPVLVAAVTRGGSGAGNPERRVTMVYAANLAGAVVGAFGVGLVIMPALGVRGALVVTALANLAVGAVALWWDAAESGDAEAAAEAAAEASAAELPVRPLLEPLQVPLGPGALGVLAGLSGCRALGLQVIWSRVLGLILGSSVYALTVVLGTVMAGLGLGALLAPFVLRRTRRPLRALAAVEVATLLAMLATGLAIPELPWLFIRVFRGLFDPIEGGALVGVQLVLAALLVLPTSVLMGLSTPLLLGAATGGNRDEQVASRAARIYVASTLGAILGALVTGFILLRVVGVRGALLGACVPGALTLAWLVLAGGLRSAPSALAAGGGGLARASRLVAVPCLTVLMVGVASLVLPRWDPGLLSAGTYTYAGTLPNLADLDRDGFLDQYRNREFQLRFHREGLVSTVTVEDYAKNNTRYMKSSGKVEASVPIDPARPSLADMPTQVLLSALPLMVADQPRRVLVIGLGSGVTAGAALAFDVEVVECAEIEAAVVDAVVDGWFDDWNGKPLADPRFRCLVGEDGRNRLLLHDEPYDVIVSQPSDPWLSGAANLFTQEFFQEGRAALTPDGIFCQWIQLYSLEPELFRSLLATFASVFEDVHIFRPPGTQEVLVLGARKRLRFDVGKLAQAGARPAVASLLQRAGLRQGSDVLSLHLLGGDDLRAWVKGARFNTDDNLHVELAAPRSLYTGLDAAAQIVNGLMARVRGGLLDVLDGLPAEPHQRVAAVVRLAESQARRGGVNGAQALARELAEQTAAADLAPVLRLLGDLAHLRGSEEEALEAWHQALQADPGHAATRLSLAAFHTRRGEDDQALAILDTGLELKPDNLRLRYFRGRLRLFLGQIAAAVSDLEAAGRFAGADELADVLQLANRARAGRLGGTRSPLDGGDPAAEPGEGLPSPPSRGRPSAANWRALGRKMLQSGRVDLAVSAFDEALARAGADDVRTLVDLASALRQQATPEALNRALTLLQHAVEWDPGYQRGWRQLGELLYARGEHRQVVTVLETYLKQVPGSSVTARASLLLADSLRQLGRGNDAVGVLEKALDLAPDHPLVLLNLGGLHAAAGRRQAAEPLYRRYLELAPPGAPQRQGVEAWLQGR